MYESFTSALSTLTPDRFYTIVLNAVVYSYNNMQIRITLGLEQILAVLRPGENVITVPFYYNGSDNVFGYNYDTLHVGDNVAVLRFSVWDGIKEQLGQSLVVHDNAAPTSSDNTIQWSVGDTVWNTGADNVVLWKCTVAGAPGTWGSLSLP